MSLYLLLCLYGQVNIWKVAAGGLGGRQDSQAPHNVLAPISVREREAGRISHLQMTRNCGKGQVVDCAPDVNGHD